ncbi:multidrug effflux MFS transporter [Streptomyces sp. NPDC059455]|uniref:multidrug effflux MFS transporter n=1 Tax=Streptomyces sp. NPDC059455 TaxID=3346837 RepID=UPI00368C0258
MDTQFSAPTRPVLPGPSVILVLGGVTALPSLSMDMYLPALPDVAHSLGASAAAVALTLTASLVGQAVGQLVFGPMSDRWGRRRVMVSGMVGYVLATALCALASNVGLLIVFRLLQGGVGAAPVVVAFAVVRDLYAGAAMARFSSSLMLVSGLAPIIAPLIGGQLLRVTDWRGVFGGLTAFGVLLVLALCRYLPETLPPERRLPAGVGAALRTMHGLLADRVFTGYILTAGLTFAVLFAYVSASPFIVQNVYGASPQTYSLLFGVNSVGLLITGQVNGKLLVARFALDQVLAAGITVLMIASLALLVLTTGVLGTVGLLPVAIALFALISAIGVILPNASAQALTRTSDAAGSASALFGTSTLASAAVASPLVGLTGEHTATPMAVVQLTSAGLAGLCLLGLCRDRRSSTD